MSSIDFRNEFRPEAHSILNLFQRPGTGYLIPYYQRDYSWDEDNIKQLVDDLVSGVEGLIDNPENMRFLGTSITIQAREKDLSGMERRALPTKVEVVIDGQQRLSTFSMLSAILHNKIDYYLSFIEEYSEPHNKIIEASNYWKKKLWKVFSVDCGMGDPERKPVVIRQGVDSWTYEDDGSSYSSDVSNYLYQHIHRVYYGSEVGVPKGALVKNNVNLLDEYADDISKAHVVGSDFEGHFPSGSMVTEVYLQQAMWRYERPELKDILESSPQDPSTPDFAVVALSNLFLLCFFFLERCCITLIEPSREELAFDMFQSLNATGTPLTAIEVFKPLVVRNERDYGGGYDQSPSQNHFDNIDRMFDRVTSASTKNRRTNQLVTTFALCLDGKKLSNRFSEQRKWIQENYKSRTTLDQKRDFTKKLSDVSSYLYDDWMLYKGRDNLPIKNIQGHKEAELASTCFLYLKSVNHNIANGHLARFYANLINEEGDDRVDEFVQAVKATAAFFTLWRSTKSTSGLDNVYRRLMRDGGRHDNPIVDPMKWTGPEGSLTSENLKKYFARILEDQKIASEDQWLARSTPGNLSYDTVRKVCRFCLFVSAHDTIPDESKPGLMKQGTHGCSPYLTIKRWKSDDLQVEHIAPSEPPEDHSWDPEIYVTDAHHEIGNLTLLPKNVNISASNRGWEKKRLYYQHLGIDDPDKIAELRQQAKSEGVELAPETVKLLQEASYSKHLSPITSRSSENWDREFIQSRTKRISEILWDRLSPWILC
jgi:hypothetical protein